VTVSGGDQGGAADTSIDGGTGDDVLRGGDSGTLFRGGLGNDVMVGGNGWDVFEEGTTDSTAFFGGGYFERAPGATGSGSDTLIGRGQRGGLNSYDGDLVTYRGRVRTIHADLDGKRDDGSPGERDRIAKDIESLEGGARGDVLIGSPGANLIAGHAGSDQITGGPGGDSLYPGAGRADRLGGGAGHDIISGNSGANVIDAGPGVDYIDAAGVKGKGVDVINTRDRAGDSINCLDGLERLEIDALDYVGGVELCDEVSRNGTAAAVIGGTRWPRFEVRTTNERAIIESLDCPQDATDGCAGVVTLEAEGSSVGSVPYRLPPNSRDDDDYMSDTLYVPLASEDAQRLRERCRTPGRLVVERSGASKFDRDVELVFFSGC
jgi:RTX calcium-binding nonapeptide repeat (4 copies)